MELLELVSSHVTVPVIGVVLCALMVFTFGFRSPAQPPSFTFEEHPEKRNKKRSKQTKIKSSNNGSPRVTDLSADTPSKATTESPKAGRVPSKPKSEIKKEATQDLKGEKKLKAKKEAGKGGVKIHNLQAEDAPALKKEAEENGEWTTIQVSKKSKKAKPSKKEGRERAEPVVEAQHESDTAPEIEVLPVADVSPVIATASPAITVDTPANTAILPSIADDTAADAAVSSAVTADVAADTAVSPTDTAVSPTDTAVSPAITAAVPTSPESSRNKNKKRKEKVIEKKQAEEKDAPTDAVDMKPVPVESTKPQSEEHGPSKKKNKKDKKPTSKVSASVSETVVADELLVPEATETKDVYQISIPVDAPELPVVEQTKPVQKNKKQTSKGIVQKEVSQTGPDMQIRPPEKSQEAANDSLTSAPSKVVKPANIESDASPSEQHLPSPVTASRPPVGISFDEIGDPWVDAAPKSKKKKARRDN